MAASIIRSRKIRNIREQLIKKSIDTDLQRQDDGIEVIVWLARQWYQHRHCLRFHRIWASDGCFVVLGEAKDTATAGPDDFVSAILVLRPLARFDVV